MKKIDKRIVKVEVGDFRNGGEKAPTPIVDQMHESIQRPELLSGTTYKIKSPTSDHALYVTINDLTLNAGTEHEVIRPFEIFVNSKNMEQFQWVVALTRVISAVFRKGGDVVFLVEELKSVFDPQGGYWKKAKFIPSVVAEIGDVLEKHFTKIGLLKTPDLPNAILAASTEQKADRDEGWRDTASLCAKCHMKGVVVKDGCATCVDCGDSKCG